MRMLIKQKRKEAGLTQAELSAALGYTTAQFISNWERGLAAPPPKAWKKLGKMLKIPTKVFVDQSVAQFRSDLIKTLNR